MFDAIVGASCMKFLHRKISFATVLRYHPTKGMNWINASQTKPTRILSHDLPAIDRENPTSMPTIQSMRCGFDEEGLFSIVDFKLMTTIIITH